MFIDVRNLQERRADRDSQFEGTRDIRNGYLFEVNGSVEGDREGLIWFKALDGNSEPFQVFYNGVIGDLRANMFVKIERNPKDPARWQVSEFDTGIYFNDQSTYEQLPSLSAIPAKADYEWPPGFPGAKALNIFPRAITDFAVRPTSPASMKARVYSGIYPGATNYARFQGPVNTKDFTADVPGAGLARLAAISIDSTGTLNYTNGTTFVDGLPMPDASLPAVPASQMLISAIRLVNGMTAIEESNFDLEMRPLMANGTVNVKVSEVWDNSFSALMVEAINAAQDTLDLGNVAGGGDVDIDFNDGQMFLQGSDGFFGIGHVTPTQLLEVRKDQNALTAIGLRNNDTGAGAFLEYRLDANALGFAIGLALPTHTTLPDYANFGFIDVNASASGFVMSANKSDGTIQFRTGGRAVANTRLYIKGDGNVGIGTTSPAAKLHVDQASTTAAIPVLYLDQADISEEMIQFETTIGTGNAIEAVGAKTLTVTHFIKITLPGGLTRYLEAGTIA